MKFADYIKCPQESVEKDSWIYLIKILFLYLFITYIPRALTGIIQVIYPVFENSKTSILGDYPLLFVIIVPPIIEELAFRLSLKRSVPLLFISSMFFFFICSAYIFGVHVYTWDKLASRVVLSIIFSLLIILVHKKIFNIKYSSYFYLSSVLFALTHLINFNFHDSNLSHVLISLINTILIIPSGIILGYVRVTYGLSYSIVFHFIHNFIPMSLYFSVKI